MQYGLTEDLSQNVEFASTLLGLVVSTNTAYCTVCYMLHDIPGYNMNSPAARTCNWNTFVLKINKDHSCSESLKSCVESCKSCTCNLINAFVVTAK